MNLRPSFEADDNELRERFVQELSEYLSTKPEGAEESFGAYAVRTNMSLQTIFETWKKSHLAGQTIDHVPTADRGRGIRLQRAIR